MTKKLMEVFKLSSFSSHSLFNSSTTNRTEHHDLVTPKSLISETTTNPLLGGSKPAIVKAVEKNVVRGPKFDRVLPL